MSLELKESLPSSDPVLSLLYGPEGKTLYPGGHFRSDEAAMRRLAHLDGPRRDGRPHAPKGVQALLQRENAFAPLHPAQELNLDLAGKHGTVYLLTGQQPGLLGGPVLWYYKALTCLALAKESSEKLGLPVVPVFWVAGDDSDLRECNHLELLEDLPADFPSVLSLPFPDPDRTLPVGSRPLDPHAAEALLSRLAVLWKPATMAALRAVRPAEGNLADAFLRLAHRHLAPHGMLFLNGNSRDLRKAARPVLELAVRQWRTFQAGLEKGTRALEAAGIEAPVGLREGVVHAFALRDGERRRLFATGRGGEGPEVHSADRPGVDILPGLGQIELTHDVFTRLLVADHILPVLGHVLGPAEIRYFAQMAPVFLEETGDMPLVHPRMSAAVMPAADAAAFAAEGISPSQAAVLKPSELRQRLMDKAWKAHPASVDLPSEPPRELLDGLRRSHTRHFKDTGPLERMEKALQGSWRRYLRTLERMAYRSAAGGGDKSLGRRLRWMGNGAGQDRHLNIHSLLDLIGEEGLKDLADKSDAAAPGRRIFTFAERKRA